MKKWQIIVCTALCSAAVAGGATRFFLLRKSDDPAWGQSTAAKEHSASEGGRTVAGLVPLPQDTIEAAKACMTASARAIHVDGAPTIEDLAPSFFYGALALKGGEGLAGPPMDELARLANDKNLRSQSLASLPADAVPAFVARCAERFPAARPDAKVVLPDNPIDQAYQCLVMTTPFIGLRDELADSPAKAAMVRIFNAVSRNYTTAIALKYRFASEAAARADIQNAFFGLSKDGPVDAWMRACGEHEFNDEGARQLRQLADSSGEFADQPAAGPADAGARLDKAKSDYEHSTQALNMAWGLLSHGKRQELLPGQRAWVRRKMSECKVEGAAHSGDASTKEIARLRCEISRDTERRNFLMHL